jgi:hypothetical protein
VSPTRAAFHPDTTPERKEEPSPGFLSTGSVKMLWSDDGSTRPEKADHHFAQTFSKYSDR